MVNLRIANNQNISLGHDFYLANVGLLNIKVEEVVLYMSLITD
jgi:hypothetical protein